MHWINDDNLEIIFSNRRDGDMLFKSDDNSLNEKVKENRRVFFEKHSIDFGRVINIAGSHSNNIFFAQEKDAGSGSLDPKTRVKNFDGLITNVKNIYLMVTGADCFPIFFYDRKNHAIGIAHAGWKGVLNGVSIEMIKRLNPAPFVDKNNHARSAVNKRCGIKVWIGPGIQKCHFEVKAAPEGSEPRPEDSGREDVADLFSKKYSQFVTKNNDKFFIDLSAIIAHQLMENGIDSKNITQHPGCTFCETNKWFSFRRDKPKNVEAAAFMIGLKK